jgi:hypothetical protein
MTYPISDEKNISKRTKNNTSKITQVLKRSDPSRKINVTKNGEGRAEIKMV